jgi:adenylate cyclase class 2
MIEIPIEYEAKVKNIDPEEVGRRIIAAGGEEIGTKLLRRYVYDVTPGDRSTWIRLRADDSGVTLTVKKIETDAIDGVQETEIGVSDFSTANTLLEMMGFKAKSYQENSRRSYELAGGRLEIDQWPLIPPYLEIEAESTEKVVEIAGILGYAEGDLTAENTTAIYAQHGIDLDKISILRF